MGTGREWERGGETGREWERGGGRGEGIQITVRQTTCMVLSNGPNFSETSLIQHSVGLEKSAGLRGCLFAVTHGTVPHKMAGL